MLKKPPEGQGENTNISDRRDRNLFKIQTHVNRPCNTKWTAQTGLRLPFKKKYCPNINTKALLTQGEKKNQWKPIYIYCKYRILKQKDVTYFYIFTWVMHNKHCKGKTEPYTSKTVLSSRYSEYQHTGITAPQSGAEKWSWVSPVKGQHEVVLGADSRESVTRSYWCSERVITDRCSTEEQTSAEDLGSSKPISSTSIYFANWISLWLI